jgi:hypothetical protein
MLMSQDEQHVIGNFLPALVHFARLLRRLTDQDERANLSRLQFPAHKGK